MKRLIFLFMFILILSSVSVDAGFDDVFDFLKESFSFFFVDSNYETPTGHQALDGVGSEAPTNCDEDNDGYYKIGGGCNGNDCKPKNPHINPGVLEVDEKCLDGLDNNCNGLIDANDPGCIEGGGLFCGDGICDTINGETCSICPQDCGQCNLCGNGVVDTGETCDNGVNNGVVCSPAYGSSCTYCNTQCKIITLNGPYCGDGIKQASNEVCDGGSIPCTGSSGEIGTKSCKSDCTNWKSCIYTPIAGGEICSNSIDDDDDCSGDTNNDGVTCSEDGYPGTEVCCPGDVGVDCLDPECLGATDGYGYYLCCAAESDCASLSGTFCDFNYGICGESNCNDNLDNDGDTYSDCYDWDCATSTSCAQYYGNTEFNCDDDYDNDQNNYEDCDDIACLNDPICEDYYFSGGYDYDDGDEICDNGLDDDADGYFDCDDYKCYNYYSCIDANPDLTLGQEICGDGYDNDFDGLTDCYDSECAACTDNQQGYSQYGNFQSFGTITQDEKLFINKNLEIILPNIQRISLQLRELEIKYKVGNHPLQANRVRVVRLEIKGVIPLMYDVIENSEDMQDSSYSSSVNKIYSMLSSIVIDLKEVSDYEATIFEY